MSLENKTVSGVFWSFLQKVGSQGVTFLVTILLARFLAPSDFGLIGMLMIFIQVSQAIVDGGFNLALIQKKEVQEEDYSSVFYINLVVGCALYIALYFIAPRIAEFYNQPLLSPLTKVLALIFVINAFSYVQEARLTKELRFKILMLVNLPSTVLGGLVSIIMALLGFGVWSIVAMQLVTRTAFAIQIWIYSRWRPLTYFNIKNIIPLFSFGSKLLIARVVGVLYDNIFLVIIGKFFPLSSVGYYQNAFNLATIPSMTITTVLSRVTFPIFSIIQDNDVRLKQGYKRIMQQAFFWICPIYVLAAVLAPVLFEFVFTSKWLPAVPYFRWLCLVAIFQPLYNYNLNIVNVKGRSNLFLKLQLIRRAITTFAVIGALPFGISALVAVQGISAVLTFLFFSYSAGRFISYGIKEQIKDIGPIFILSIAIGVGVLFLDRQLVDYSNISRLLVGFGIGGATFGIIAYLLKLPSFIDFRNLLISRISGKFLINL